MEGGDYGLHSGTNTSEAPSIVVFLGGTRCLFGGVILHGRFLVRRASQFGRRFCWLILVIVGGKSYVVSQCLEDPFVSS